jgi:heme-degrading monooxygenase HmoA
MPISSDPESRYPAAPAEKAGEPVTLINSFVVPVGRDERFRELWTEASTYFRDQPGFLSLRLHRAVDDGADFRFVNIARWETLRDFQAAHATDVFRRIVVSADWQEFPANPALYEVVVAADAGEPAVAS